MADRRHFSAAPLSNEHSPLPAANVSTLATRAEIDTPSPLTDVFPSNCDGANAIRVLYLPESTRVAPIRPLFQPFIFAVKAGRARRTSCAASREARERRVASHDAPQALFARSASRKEREGGRECSAAAMSFRSLV